MKAPQWLDDTVRSFGRQLKFERLSLGESGVAGVAFADGAELKLEYLRERLAVMVTRPVVKTAEAAAATLAAAHPAARRAFAVRSGFFPGSDKAFFVTRLRERDVTADLLAKAFQELWIVSAAAVRRAA